MSSSALTLPAAQRMQEVTNAGDLSLRDYARARHETVRWWWGGRSVPAQHTHVDGDAAVGIACQACLGATVFGAWCYVCDRMVVTWQRAYPITQLARAAILQHRNEHLACSPNQPGNGTGVTSTPDGASTNGGPRE